MGLDGVELVMNFEEAFGIQITDEEATSCLTPRMVIDMVFSKLKTADEHVCRSQRAFYIIRRVLVHAFGLKRTLITPDMRLREFVPEPKQKDMWEQFRTALLPRDWPVLVRPRWMSRSILVLCLTAFVLGASIGTHWSGHVRDGLACGVGLAVLFGMIALLITRPYCICIPTHIESIRDLIPHAITSERMTGWTREEVAVVVKRIVTQQLGFHESEFTEDLRFREDLNVL